MEHAAEPGNGEEGEARERETGDGERAAVLAFPLSRRAGEEGDPTKLGEVRERSPG